MKRLLILVALLWANVAYATTSTIPTPFPPLNMPQTSANWQVGFNAARSDINALWAAVGSTPVLGANQLLGALTPGVSAGINVPSCNGASNALIWTPGVGFGCNSISGGGGGGVASWSGDGALYTNSASTGVVTATLGTQTANTLFAGPASGSPTTPTFRTLQSADLPIPVGANQNGGNICAGYSTALACALAVGYADPRVYYGPGGNNSSYPASVCNGGSDDTAGFEFASFYTRLPVMNPSNGSSQTGAGGTVRCQWFSPFVMQNDNVAIFHFPETPTYNDLLDKENLKFSTNGISQNGMITTTVSTTSGTNMGTVASCSGILANNDIYSTNIPGGATVTSCSGTTLTWGGGNASATASGTSLYVVATRSPPYNCVVNLHAHTNLSMSYINARGDGMGGVFSGIPFGGTVGICDDVNTSTQNLPMINLDHVSLRQMGDGIGGAVNVSTGLPTGALGGNLLEVRATRLIINSTAYGVFDNAADFMGDFIEVTSGCAGMITGANSILTHVRAEYNGNGGGYCTAVVAARTNLVTGGCGIVVSGSFTGLFAPFSVTNSMFQGNGGPAVCISGSDGAPGVTGGNAAIVGNWFSGDASAGRAGLDAEIVFDNWGGAPNSGTVIAGNTFATLGGGKPNYVIGFEGVGDTNISIGPNGVAPGAYNTAFYHFHTETPTILKSWGNSGEPDFSIGTLTGFGTVTPQAGLDNATGKFLARGGTAPTINSCGTSPTISGADSSFILTMGSGTLTSCVVNYGTTWLTAPKVCDLTPANAAAAAWGTTGAYVSAISTTQLTVTGANLTNAAYGVHCY